MAADWRTQRRRWADFSPLCQKPRLSLTNDSMSLGKSECPKSESQNKCLGFHRPDSQSASPSLWMKDSSCLKSLLDKPKTDKGWVKWGGGMNFISRGTSGDPSKPTCARPTTAAELNCCSTFLGVSYRQCPCSAPTESTGYQALCWI